ncbi:hypothetical protein [uncultured Finegoldia sp.]|uniref:hypothetical protein n=1 Tax=uncultured Finegoldia sp. TaxID=328009 RepID=UPI002618457F|nr:hypothetical protein [uncultured Finegoldia sp.]
MAELKKREQFNSDRSVVFETIKHQILDNSKPTGVKNQYVIDNLGVTMTYTITEHVVNEKFYIDLNSKSMDGFLRFDFSDNNTGCFVDIDMKLNNKSIFGGLMNFVMSVDKMENKLIYELKKHLGEI